MSASIFHQLFEQESCTYTYLIADAETKEAALIDPVFETVQRDLKLITELGLKLKYILETHVHADHVTGANEIRKITKAQTAISQNSGVACADLLLKDGEVLSLGKKQIKVVETHGHTNTCVSYVFENKVFTGDALLIRGTGRTDFQQGNSEKLFESIHERLFLLPDETLVYPAHDYNGQTHSTIGSEKKHNPRVGESVTKEQFVKMMKELNLANPKKINIAVPANLQCGKLST